MTSLTLFDRIIFNHNDWINGLNDKSFKAFYVLVSRRIMFQNKNLLASLRTLANTKTRPYVVNMWASLTNWWQQRIINRSTITQQHWQNAIASIPLLHRLNDMEKNQLIRLSTLFLYYKTYEGAHHLQVTQAMKMIIALQACLPILHLGIDWYRGWVSIIVYPAQFVPERRYVDEYGVEHRSRSVLSGESWHKGPVILSWEDTEHSGQIDGSNLVIHEFAHKLDVLNGKTNGFPPLHKGMDTHQWVQALSEAYEDFQNRTLTWNDVPIDNYAASSPAEFFAVFSEVFFERPDILNYYYPEVYQQFSQFYRQDTLARLQ